MRIRYTRRAFADREAIYEYYDRRSPETARDIKAFIKKRISDLSCFPERYPLNEELGARAFVLGRYPYIVYYRIRNYEISILHIRHTSRRPWRATTDRLKLSRNGRTTPSCCRTSAGGAPLPICTAVPRSSRADRNKPSATPATPDG